MVVVLRAFAFNQSSAAEAGGVYGNGGGCAQGFVFGEWRAIDALTVATSNKNAGEQHGHKTYAPNHFIQPQYLQLQGKQGLHQQKVLNCLIVTHLLILR